MADPKRPGVANALASEISSALEEDRSIRFFKVSIVNEKLVLEKRVSSVGTLDDDLGQLQGTEIIENDVPAYLLTRLDLESDQWLAIYYVPETANVKQKMLYSTMRMSFVHSLNFEFSDSIFASSKEELTPEAYAAHLRHKSAPNPMSAREKELADLRAAEAESSTYNGSRARQSPVGGAGVGLKWTNDVEQAVKEVAMGQSSRVAVITIDPTSETLVLKSSSEIAADEVGTTLPTSDPCFAFFLWPHDSTRDIVFIYSCPSSSPVKHRMLYSSGSSSVYQSAKLLLSPIPLANRKVETSDPQEVDEAFLRAELGVTGDADAVSAPQENKAFARPRGPARKR